MEAVQPKKADWSIPSVKHAKLYPEGKKPRKISRWGGWIQSFVETILQRYERVSEIRLLMETYLIALVLPTLFSKLPMWYHWSHDRMTRVHLFEPHEPLSAVLVAPIMETLFIFVPVLEIARFIGVPRWLTTLGFTVFFECLHSQRDWDWHLLMLPGIFMLVVAYEAPRRRSLVHAIVFAITVHEAYNLAIFVLDPRSYEFLIN